MEKEILLKREDGTVVKLRVTLSADFRNVYPNVTVETKTKGKRKFNHVYSGDDWDYRKLSMEDRKNWVLGKQLEHVTPEEINGLFKELTEDIYNKVKINSL